MNVADFCALILIVLSAILGLARGLIREILGVGAWIGAVVAAMAGYPYVQPFFHRLIHNENIADPIGFAVIFLIVLILLSVVAKLIADLVRNSLLSGLDHTLGAFFGAGRGVFLLIVAYVVGGLLVSSDRWPAEIRNARSLPYIYKGAVWVTKAMPEQFRPRLQTPPGVTPTVFPTAAEE